MRIARALLTSSLAATFALGFFAGGVAHAKQARKLATKVEPDDMAGPSKAVTQDMIDALAAELERSMSMHVPGAPAPYFVSYKVTEVEVNDAAATLGSKTASQRRHFVSIDAHVHVGSYQMDNTNFVVPQSDSTDGIATAELPIEATPAIARKLAWLVTDQAYKEALEQYTAKREALRTGARSDAPSYTKVKPLVLDKPVAVVALESKEALEKRAAAVSRAFIGKPAVRDSHVAFTSFLERRWYLNSEGTSSHDTRRVSGVMLVASGQAKDGQELSVYFTRYGHSAADLPSNAELQNAAHEMVENLDGLAKADLIDAYTGPVLFEGEGAVGLVRYTLHPHLTGTPPPVGVSAQDLQVFGGGFAKRLGRRVLPTNMAIFDDPTATFSNKVPVIGGYRFDDEGVEAQRIDIVVKGMLETLPTSRTPSKELPDTNGHARRSVQGGLFRGSPTNLTLTGRGGLSHKRLEAKLIEAVKREGLPYGLIIRQFDDVAITSSFDLSRIELVQLLRSQDPNAPPMASLAYKVYPDGREELVRGVQLKRVDVNVWRSISAFGKKPTVENFLASTENPLAVQLRGPADGYTPSSGVESSITTPDLLVPELTVSRSTFGTREPPLVPHP